ncbi:MAG: hypothetical protein ACLQPV_01335, partial [Vulcanimicrobiaceae bacterium]
MNYDESETFHVPPSEISWLRSPLPTDFSIGPEVESVQFSEELLSIDYERLAECMRSRPGVELRVFGSIRDLGF